MGGERHGPGHSVVRRALRTASQETDRSPCHRSHPSSTLCDVNEGSDLGVVIPTQNRWSVLERTVEALRRQTVTGFQLVVVVDKGAQPPSFLNGVQVVERSQGGVSAARNTGLAATTLPIVLFLGDDTIPDVDLVARHLAVHRRHPQAEVGVLGAVRWHPEAARGRLQRWLEWSGNQFDYRTIVGEEAGWGRLYSSNVSLKRQLLLDVGGFDEDFVFGYEDTELGLRLDAKGLRLLYEPEAVVQHLHRYTWPAVERRFLLVGGAEYLMVRKHPEVPPHFLQKLTSHRPVSPVSLWPRLVDLVPSWAGRLRREAEERADACYSKRLAPGFVAGWLAAAELDELGEPVLDGQFEQVVSARLGEQRWLGELLPLLPRGSPLLAMGCSATLAMALADAGYDVTFVTQSPADRGVLRRRLQNRRVAGDRLAIKELEDLGATDGFAAGLVFGSEGAGVEGPALAAAERRSALVAVSLPGRRRPDASEPNRPGGAATSIKRGRQAQGATVLRRRYDDGSELRVYRGGGPRHLLRGPSRSRPPVEAAKAYLGRWLGRRPWVPPNVSRPARRG